MDALIFIDTNIFLDFYRIRKSDVSMKYIQSIIDHKDLIITSSQVEMEYKKNRQPTILESISEVNKLNNQNLAVPAILSDAKPFDMIKKSRESINRQKLKLKSKIENILKEPGKYDPVYKSLQKIFKNSSPYNLGREKKERVTIRNLAKKRFILGYPPRKKSDNSIGDAINWEWIIKCSEESKKHIILVTRDSDFGVRYDGELYLNDWLDQEFKDRLSKQRKIILTDKLSQAFKQVEIPVSKEMIEEEEKVIGLSDIFNQIQRANESIRGFRNSFHNPLSASAKSLRESIYGPMNKNISFQQYLQNYNEESIENNGEE